MASLIPGFEYDIFISYRQKDNKGDRWVSEFVEALKTELESTFKEEISVYFDINPHDGLLETHDVDASLKVKLKCLVFIPIISRTYCDPKSFAWEHEFKAFVEQALGDQFGLKVKLLNGNVASRVLPVRIHDLDISDIKLCESLLGGVLRGVEFIFIEPGVNRSLTPKDDERRNLNGTIYRNQINKVALAIKEIILGLQTGPAFSVKESAKYKEPSEEVYKEEKLISKPDKYSNRKFLYGLAALALLLITAIIAYSRIFNRGTLEKLRSSGDRISIVVMPFRNMSNDTVWNVWQDGIQNEIINSLTNSGGLKVRQIESTTGLLRSKGLTDYASITPSVARTISQKLDANVVVCGSIKQTDSAIRLNAQLIDSRTEEIFKSFQVDGDKTKIFPLIDSLSKMVKDCLIISNLKKGQPRDFNQLFSTTSSVDAYRYFIYGNKAFSESDWTTAANWYLQAIKYDSTYTQAAVWLSAVYLNLGLYQEGKKWCLNIYNKQDQLPMQQRIWANLVYAGYFQTEAEVIKWTKQLIEIDDQQPLQYYILGNHYIVLDKYEEAAYALEKSLDIYSKWGVKPYWVYNYLSLGYVYHKIGKYNKEKRLYKKAERDFPDDPDLIQMEAFLYLTKGDSVVANRYIEKYVLKLKENSTTEVAIQISLAQFYSEAGIFDKADNYYRTALSLQPQNYYLLNILGYFLIDKEQNIEEGLDLVSKALEHSPDDYSILECKGWGLFKQGKYQEALDVLQKSWDLRLMNAVYNHSAYLHLEAAKKAVAGQK